MALTFRIIARLDIRNADLIKTIRLEGVRKVGDPNEFARRYDEQGIDELVYLDAVASLYGRNSLHDLVSAACSDVFSPLGVGGGIRNVDDASRLFQSGADKIVLNTGGIEHPALITEIAYKYGSQAVVLQLDAKRKDDGTYEAYTHGGRQPSGRDVIGWAHEGIERGAGELLLTSIDNEGTQRGLDCKLLERVAEKSRVPVAASGGYANPDHAVQASQAGASGIAIAGALHYGRTTVGEIKAALKEAGMNVRMT